LRTRKPLTAAINTSAIGTVERFLVADAFTNTLTTVEVKAIDFALISGESVEALAYAAVCASLKTDTLSST
jgi:hypothetical protein